MISIHVTNHEDDVINSSSTAVSGGDAAGKDHDRFSLRLVSEEGIKETARSHRKE